MKRSLRRKKAVSLCDAENSRKFLMKANRHVNPSRSTSVRQLFCLLCCQLQ